MKLLNLLMNAALAIAACILVIAALPPGVVASALFCLARSATNLQRHE